MRKNSEQNFSDLFTLFSALSFFNRLNISDQNIDSLIERFNQQNKDFPLQKMMENENEEKNLFLFLEKTLKITCLSHIDPKKLRISKERALSVGQKKDLYLLVSEKESAIIHDIIGLKEICFHDLVQKKEQYTHQILVLTSYKSLRKSLLHFVKPLLTQYATSNLSLQFPQFSALYTTTKGQNIVLKFLCFSFVLLLFWNVQMIIIIFHVLFSIFFFASGCMRFMPLFSRKKTIHPPSLLLEEDHDTKPIYTILVPLYHETKMIPQLLDALNKIIWPKDKLEIKLICEEDDVETIEAIRSHSLCNDSTEIIEIAASYPRTKPKALNYALPLTSGEFIVVYDAEDIPHPLQILEAWHSFQKNEEVLACLQAPLEVTNKENGFIPYMFTMDYINIFRGILPWLSKKNFWLPLGGTSNHFRRAILEQVGAWDPYNVTEDADLSIRLVRMGYRIEMISYPTYEKGPETFKIWKNQRARWLKGWLQCWFVHMRSFPNLYKEIRSSSFWIFQFLGFGAVMSAASLIFFFPAIGISLYLYSIEKNPFHSVIFFVFLDIITSLLNYLSYILLHLYCAKKSEKKDFKSFCFNIIPYWFMISLAAYVAIYQLIRSPHYWNKTPHE